jgi:acylglycerol lipase
VFRASDGYPLFYRHWRPRGRPRGTIIALHGIQSHSGWYLHSSQQYAQAGYEVYFLDRRGSGLNARERGHAAHEERLIADVGQFLKGYRWERRHAPPQPVILMGVSWGGKLATAIAATFPDEFAGLALLYPGLAPKLRPSWWQRRQLDWASVVGWGEATAPIPLNEPALFTDSPAWQEVLRRDELALHRVTVDFLRANLQLTQRIEQSLTKIRGPVLMLLAGRDDVIDNTANRAYLAQMTSARTQLIEYPEARHTLEFEPDPHRFIRDVVEWLHRVSRGKVEG